MVNSCHVRIVSHVEIPLEEISAIDLSMPAGTRLQSLEGLVGQAPEVIARQLGDLGAKVVGRTDDELESSLTRLARHLNGLNKDAVWRVDDLVDARPAYAEHLRPHLGEQAPAVFAFGLRDSFQNRFKPAYSERLGTVARPGEPLGSRPYHVLFSAGDDPGHVDLGVAEFTPGGIRLVADTRAVRFAAAATPLVWDHEPVPLWARVAYQADLRHEWHLPPSRWDVEHRQLQHALLSESDPERAGRAVGEMAARLGLARETGYYLSSVGISGDGRLILISAHGSTDALAERQIRAGAERAVITEEGGSCGYALWECAKDYRQPDRTRRNASGDPIWEKEPRYFGMTTYWRPCALALAVIKLRSYFTEGPFREAT